MWCIYKNEADSIFWQKTHLFKISHVWEKQTHGCIILTNRHFHVNWFPNVLGSGHTGNKTCVIKLWVQRRFKPQSLQFYRPKHILNRHKRKWVGAFTWITWNSWGKKWSQVNINTPLSFFATVNDCEPTSMIAVVLLLALAAQSSAKPLSSEDIDKQLLAEVRALIQSISSLQLASVLFLFYLGFLLQWAWMFDLELFWFLNELHITVFCSVSNRNTFIDSMAFQMVSKVDRRRQISFKPRSRKCRNSSNWR